MEPFRTWTTSQQSRQVGSPVRRPSHVVVDNALLMRSVSGDVVQIASIVADRPPKHQADESIGVLFMYVVRPAGAKPGLHMIVFISTGGRGARFFTCLCFFNASLVLVKLVLCFILSSLGSIH